MPVIFRYAAGCSKYISRCLRHKLNTIPACSMLNMTVSTILCSIMLCFSYAAQAYTPAPFFSPHIYTRLYGGINFLDAKRKDQSQQSVNTKFKTGYNLGAAVGYSWTRFFRADVSTSYLNYGHAKNASLNQENRYQLYQVHIMANGFIDLPIPFNFPKLTPFIGAGLGYDWVTFTRKTHFLTSNSQDKISTAEAFAWQASAGLNYNLRKRIQLGLAYTLSSVFNHRLYGLFATPNQVKALYNQAIMLQLTVHASPSNDRIP